MSATPNSTVLEKVARALAAEDYREKRRGDYNDAETYASRHWGEYQPEAQAALAACEAEAMRRELAQAALEIEEAAKLVAAQGLSGMGSIFNEAAARKRALLARLEAKP